MCCPAGRNAPDCICPDRICPAETRSGHSTLSFCDSSWTAGWLRCASASLVCASTGQVCAVKKAQGKGSGSCSPCKRSCLILLNYGYCCLAYMGLCLLASRAGGRLSAGKCGRRCWRKQERLQAQDSLRLWLAPRFVQEGFQGKLPGQNSKCRMQMPAMRCLGLCCHLSAGC